MCIKKLLKLAIDECRNRCRTAYVAICVIGDLGGIKRTSFFEGLVYSCALWDAVSALRGVQIMLNYL